MTRLSDRAYQILAHEVRRLTEDDPLQSPQRELLLKQLLRLRGQAGPPASRAELQETVQLFFPNFSAAILDKAARANRPPSRVSRGVRWVGLAMATVGSLGAGVWFVNLPYPMVRRPVAQVAPILLLPSFIAMDKHYRQAIALVEQADQLINQATAPADIPLGKQKVAAAQDSLDHLPVWFLGYYPQRYCSWASCGWKFTLDEYEQARAQIGRMEAKVFQEEQALAQLNGAEVSLAMAEELFATIPNKQAAVAHWQAALDQLDQVPDNTLASRIALDKQVAYSRNFQAVAGSVAGKMRTSLMMDVAKQYAQQAIATAQKPPHSVLIWEKAKGQWEDAIAHLAKVPAEDPGYREAQQLMAQYKSNLGDVTIRLEQEEAAQERLASAQQNYQRLLAYPSSPDLLRSQLQGILDQLQSIPLGTTAQAGSGALRRSLEQQLQALGTS